MTDYYSELSVSPDPARRVGWRRRVGQAYRFELASQLIAEGDRVVDLGCGGAGLAKYLAERDIVSRYLGIDQIAHELEAEVEVILSDYRELEPPSADVSVAIGTLVDGASRLSVDDAMTMYRWLRACAPTGIFIAIDAGELARAPWREDPVLRGVRRSWFVDEGVDLVTVGVDEVAVVWGGEIDQEAALRAAIDGPFGPFDPAEGAWLAQRAGQDELAKELLASPDVEDRLLAELVKERLQPLA